MAKDNEEPGIGINAVVPLLYPCIASGYPCRGFNRVASLNPVPVRGEAADSPDTRDILDNFRGGPTTLVHPFYLATAAEPFRDRGGHIRPAARCCPSIKGKSHGACGAAS